jgi:hypothetical protein
MKNRKSLLFFKSAKEKIGPVALTSLQISSKPGMNPGGVGICMTSKGKQAGQGITEQVRGSVISSGEYFWNIAGYRRSSSHQKCQRQR